MSRTVPVAIVAVPTVTVPVAIVAVPTVTVPVAIVAVPTVTVSVAIVVVPTVTVSVTDAPTTVVDMADAIVVGVLVTGIVTVDIGILIHGGLLAQQQLSELAQPMQEAVANVSVTCVRPIGGAAALITGVACDMKAVTKQYRVRKCAHQGTTNVQHFEINLSFIG